MSGKERERGGADEDETNLMRQGMLIKLLTAPKLTEMPQILVPPVMASERATSPVSKLMTAPAPVA